MPRKNHQPKHRRIEYILAGCDTKRKYRSKNEAEKVAEVQMLTSQRLELGTYKCQYCNYWHLTNITKK